MTAELVYDSAGYSTLEEHVADCQGCHNLYPLAVLHGTRRSRNGEMKCAGCMPPGPVESMTPWVSVYRLYAGSRILLYVGHTNDPYARWHMHAKRTPWWGDVTSKYLIWYPDKATACAQETRAIASEHPVHNVRSIARHRRVLSGSAVPLER